MRHKEARGGYSYEFGPYCLDPLERLLTKGGAPVPLSPKAFEVLLFFVRNKGKALSKDELMKAGWGDTFVEEANLTQTISVLRKALGEGLDERVYIETIPKHGYRFRLPVESKPVVIPIAPDDRRLDRRKLVLGLIGAGALLVVLCVLVVAHRPTTGPALLSVTPSFVPLVTDPGVRLYPSWAPDSKKIAFVGEVSGHLQVFTRTLGSPMSTQVTNQNDDCIHPFWSSDGTHIYFGAGANLWRVGANGGQPTLVMPRVFQASLAPDDSALAFIAAETGLGSLFISKPPGAPPKRYTEQPFANRQYLGPATVRFSPDGKKLAVSIMLRQSKPEFWLLPFPGGKPVELLRTIHPRSFISGAVQFSWMPDSRHIVFAQSSLFISSPHLWMLDTADGSIRALSSGTGTEMTPSVSPDGKRIVFASIRGSYDLIEIPVDGSSFRDFLATSRNEVTPAWSPLGTHVAYSTDRGGPREIWLRDAREGWERPIVTQHDFGDDLTFQFWDICFSPDGQRIAYRRIGQSGEAIWISTLAGDPPTRLINDPENSYQRGPAWSPDGDWLAYYATSIKTPQTIMKVRLGGNGVPVIIRSDVGIYPRWSPDGKWLLSGGPGLFLSTPDGSSSRKVSDRNYLVHGWSKDGSLAYGIRNTGRRLVLESIDPWKKQEKLVADFGPTPGSWLFGALDANILFRGFSVNPDGKSFLTSMFRATSDLWLLENFE